jgi:hypothetical protein
MKLKVHLSVADPDWIRIQAGKNRKKFINFSFEVLAGCSLLRAEGFSCSLDVLYGGLEFFFVKKDIFF